jgi:hypothetical protein
MNLDSPTTVQAVGMAYFTPSDGSTIRGPAVARVSASTLRAIEAALGPRSTPELRARAKRQVRELVETAEWRASVLPPA